MHIVPFIAERGASGFQRLPVLIFLHTPTWCDVYAQWFTNTRALPQSLATTNNKLGVCFPQLCCISSTDDFSYFSLINKHERNALSQSLLCVSGSLPIRKARNRFYTHRKETEPSSKRRTTSSSRSREWDICHYTLFSSLSHTINIIISVVHQPPTSHLRAIQKAPNSGS